MPSETLSTPASDPQTRLEAALRQAIVAVLGPEYADADPVVRPSQNPQFGDFQCNGAMALGKQTGMKPRELAQRIVDAVELAPLAETPEVAGPGFINITLRTESVAELLEAADDEHLGVTPDPDPHPVVIDLCAVNVAKQMHVGHLRSTIIGDALARVFERRDRLVHRENHLGDWGLPIAMVLHQLREEGRDFSTLDLPALDAAYRAAQLGGRNDERGLAAARRLGAGPHRIIELEEQNDSAADTIEAAKRTLVKLQGGDAELDRQWHQLIDCTLASLYDALAILEVKLGPENNRGESFYRDRLPGVIDAFAAAKLAREDDGAMVVPFEDRTRPLLIRKSDGGFLYATTDLAAVRFRAQELGASRVIYVVDARQRDHFRDVFDAVRLMDWHRTPDGVEAELVHIGFGSVLGTDKKPLKTRSGANVTLRSLLDEAVERGTAEVQRRAGDPNAPTHGLPDEELREIGRAVGIGAVKYADLSNDLVRDYVFDMDRMIAFEGDTGPYLQYAHARICSIFSKAGVALGSGRGPALDAKTPFVIAADAERTLALTLLRYGAVVADVGRVLEPHRLCAYLYELANAYSSFYQQCPVIKADDEATRQSRLRLCDLTRRVLADGLDLLGIPAPRRM
ncbi:MAG: arginine--tRNA ligase [Phycisphaerales bacterium]|nr:arginine--tRNA ligase [Phycisphaerales bacterium]